MNAVSPMVTPFRRSYSRRFVIRILTVLFVGLFGRALRADDGDLSQFTLFVHTGGGGDESVVKKVAGKLAYAGYRIRGFDDQQDTVGGPAIDYFDDQSFNAAQSIADIVNDVLKNTNYRSDLKPRRQRVRNPSGFIGVWLFGSKEN